MGEVERAVLVELLAKAPCCGRTDDQEDEELAGMIPDRRGRSWSVRVEAWGAGVERGWTDLAEGAPFPKPTCSSWLKTPRTGSRIDELLWRVWPIRFPACRSGEKEVVNITSWGPSVG